MWSPHVGYKSDVSYGALHLFQKVVFIIIKINLFRIYNKRWSLYFCSSSVFSKNNISDFIHFSFVCQLCNIYCSKILVFSFLENDIASLIHMEMLPLKTTSSSSFLLNDSNLLRNSSTCYFSFHSVTWISFHLLVVAGKCTSFICLASWRQMWKGVDATNIYYWKFWSRSFYILFFFLIDVILRKFSWIDELTLVNFAYEIYMVFIYHGKLCKQRTENGILYVGVHWQNKKKEFISRCSIYLMT